MGLFGAIGVTAGAAFVLGASLGRRRAILVAGLGWPTYALGVWIGLWGHGFSKDDEGWLIATWFVIYTSAAVVGAALGVLARRRWSMSRPSPAGV